MNLDINNYFEDIIYLDTFFKSFKGLMLKKNISDKNCYILKTQGIHMFFMKISLDVIYLNKDKKIIKIIKNIKPWRIAPLMLDCKYVLEFKNSNFIKKVKLNDIINI
ncbi:DUF192 domain-containing protein [Clostridiaceae bacterium HSG29]|nr:DUF192 domain-containing protein [Clostridiaceae bacterium HSG29]